MRCPLISVLFYCIILLSCVEYYGRASAQQQPKRISQDSSTRISGHGGSRVNLFGSEQSSSTGETGTAFGNSNGADLRFPAPPNIPYEGESTNTGVFIGAKVADGNVASGQQTNIFDLFKAQIDALIGLGKRNGDSPPLGGVGDPFPGQSTVPGVNGDPFPGQSTFPGVADNTGEDHESNPFPNYIPPPSPSSTAEKSPVLNRPFPNYVPPPSPVSKTEKLSVPNRPFPIYIPSPPTRVRVPAPVVDYDYTDQAPKIIETTEQDPSDPFPNYIPPQSRSGTKNLSPTSNLFANDTPQPILFRTTRAPVTRRIPRTTRASAQATPIPIGGDLVPFARVLKRNTPVQWTWNANH